MSRIMINGVIGFHLSSFPSQQSYIVYSMVNGVPGVLRDQVINEKRDLLMGADFTTPWI